MNSTKGSTIVKATVEATPLQYLNTMKAGSIRLVLDNYDVPVMLTFDHEDAQELARQVAKALVGTHIPVDPRDTSTGYNFDMERALADPKTAPECWGPAQASVKNKSVKKRPLWEARRILGIKRAALRKRRDSAEEMEAQVRLWEQKVRALEDQERAV